MPSVAAEYRDVATARTASEMRMVTLCAVTVLAFELVNVAKPRHDAACAPDAAIVLPAVAVTITAFTVRSTGVWALRAIPIELAAALLTLSTEDSTAAIWTSVMAALTLSAETQTPRLLAHPNDDLGVVVAER